jgi:hypothetical protein
MTSRCCRSTVGCAPAVAFIVVLVGRDETRSGLREFLIAVARRVPHHKVELSSRHGSGGQLNRSPLPRRSPHTTGSSSSGATRHYSHTTPEATPAMRGISVSEGPDGNFARRLLANAEFHTASSRRRKTSSGLSTQVLEGSLMVSASTRAKPTRGTSPSAEVVPGYPISPCRLRLHIRNTPGVGWRPCPMR